MKCGRRLDQRAELRGLDGQMLGDYWTAADVTQPNQCRRPTNGARCIPRWRVTAASPQLFQIFQRHSCLGYYGHQPCPVRGRDGASHIGCEKDGSRIIRESLSSSTGGISHRLRGRLLARAAFPVRPPQRLRFEFRGSPSPTCQSSPAAAPLCVQYSRYTPRSGGNCRNERG